MSSAATMKRVLTAACSWASMYSPYITGAAVKTLSRSVKPMSFGRRNMSSMSGIFSFYPPSDFVPAPVQQVTFPNPAFCSLGKGLNLGQFAAEYPMFLEVYGHPLIKDTEAAVKFNPFWQHVTISMLSIACCNLEKGVMPAASFHMDNILIFPDYMQAYLRDPMGVRFNNNPDANRGFTYASIADLLEEVANTFQPNVYKPKDFSHFLLLLRRPDISPAHEEMLVFNPFLLAPSGYVGCMCHLENLLRRRFFRSGIYSESEARRLALSFVGAITGQNNEPWDDVVLANPFLYHIFRHIFPLRADYHAAALRSGSLGHAIPEGDTARGSLILGIGRHQLVHAWEWHIRNDRFVCTDKSYNMAHVVEHQRWHLPTVGAAAAHGLSTTEKNHEMQLRAFFPNHPLRNVSFK